MSEVTVVGLDLAKHVFQAHGSDKEGRKVFSQRLQREEVLVFFTKLPPCLVAMEACASSHFWARQIRSLGHDVRILPLHEVKPFVTRGKTDAKDALAISLAARKVDLRPVPIKSAEQQATAMLFHTRSFYVRQRVNAVNVLRAHMAEFGLIAPTGLTSFLKLAPVMPDSDAKIPDAARRIFLELYRDIEEMGTKIRRLEKELAAQSKTDDVVKRLRTIPGIGSLTAALIRVSVIDPYSFRSARHFSAWLGLAPTVSSSGTTLRLGRISKKGNRELRAMLFLGAVSAISSMRRKNNMPAWLRRLLENRPFKVAVIAVSNRMARIVWSLMTKGGTYQHGRTDRGAPLAEKMSLA